MHDPKPIGVLIALGLLVWAYCVLQALSWPYNQRYSQLVTIMMEEHIATAPPTTLVPQAKWLFAHRVAQLTMWRLVILPALVIGVAEGVFRRATDLRGGFLLTWWTLGIIALALACLAAWGYLTLPYLCPPIAAAGTLAALGGIGCYGLAAGRPYVA